MGRVELVNCGRIDDHEGHFWTCRAAAEPGHPKRYYCKGPPVREGGHRGFSVKVRIPTRAQQ